MLAAATALRAMAQEEPWFAGLPAPSVADLRAEFGLAGVAFDRDVRRDWQPYYLRMIGTSLRDMQRVLGGLSVAGLRIAVAATGLPDTILALHDPSTRTIRMSVFSSSGTLAHELAHDLDWQAARSLYAGSGYVVARLQFPNMAQSTAYLPWLLLLVDRMVAKTEIGYAGLIAFVVALCILAAHAQIAYMTLACACLYAIARLYQARRHRR